MTAPKAPTGPKSPGTPKPPAQRPARTRPEAAPAPQPGPRALVVALTLIVLGALFFWNVWQRDFWRPDEPRFAELAHGMERGGEWIVPQLGGESYLDVPPLAAWLPAGLHALVGGDPRIVYRIPVCLAALLGLWLTYVAGKRLLDGRIGFLAMILQASTVLYFSRATRLDDDLLFAVSVQLAVTSFAIVTRKGSSRWWAVPGWVGLAGCALTKSLLLGFVLVFPTLLFFLYFEAGAYSVVAGFRRIRQGRALLVFVALAAPWYVYAAIQHGNALFSDHLLQQHFQRITNSPYDPQLPFFYVLTLLVGFLPWVLFVPLAVLHAKDRLTRNGERLCFFWVLIMLVALCVVSSKKDGFLLVIWPPLALLISAAFFESREWFSLWEDFLRRGAFRIVPVLMKVPLFLALILVVAYFGGSLGKIEDPRIQGVVQDGSSALWALGLFAVAGAVLFTRAARVKRLVAENAAPMAAFELACAALFLFFVGGFLNQGWNLFRSARPVLEHFSLEIPPDASLATYGSREPEVYYYIDRAAGISTHLDYPDPMADRDSHFERIESFLDRNDQVFIITSESEFRSLERQFSSLRPKLYLRDEGPGGPGRTYVLLSNRPPEGASAASADG